MKLTQKTLFQCFDKSRRQSPSISDHDEITLLDVIECKPEIKSPLKKRDVPVRQPDFLLPIHVRQDAGAPQNAIIPLLNQWQLIPTDDDRPRLDHLGHFPRLPSVSHHDESTLPQVQVSSSCLQTALVHPALPFSSRASPRPNDRSSYSKSTPTMT